MANLNYLESNCRSLVAEPKQVVMIDANFIPAVRQRGWRRNGTRRGSVRGVMEPLAAAEYFKGYIIQYYNQILGDL